MLFNKLTYTMRKTPLKVMVLMALCVMTPFLSATAQSFLSTPEKIAAFRESVENAGPEVSNHELARIEDRQVNVGGRDLAFRVYDPGGAGQKPGLIYIHGGCWVGGSIDSHDEIVRYLAKASGATIVSVGYRKAPEHKYPAAHDDVFDVVSWIWSNAADLGIDRDRLGIGGESAGAYFTTATLLRLHDEGHPAKFAYQLLVYAALQGDISGGNACRSHYFERVDDSLSRYGSPLYADDLSFMPKTFNILGENEASRANQEDFLARLEKAGVEAYSTMIPDVGHDVWVWLKGEEGVLAHETAVEYMKRGFSEEEPR